VAPKRAHTRVNQEGPLTTPVPDPEKIISKGKSLQRQASGSAKTSNSGIQTDTSSFISKRPLVESPAAETHSSQEIEILSEILKVEEPSLSSNVIESVLEHDISSNLKEIITGSSQQKETSSSSSLNSPPTKSTEGVFYTLTNLPVLEDILHNLSSKGEESLALLLGQFYKAFIFHPFMKILLKVK
jgi:hypothetical protein